MQTHEVPKDNLYFVVPNVYVFSLISHQRDAIRLRLHDDGLNRRRKSGFASLLFLFFIPRVDKHFREEIDSYEL